MANIGAARKMREKGPLAKLKAQKANGAVKPAVAKGALAILRERKRKPPLAALKERKAQSSKFDFTEDDILYHNARIVDHAAKLGPIGTVDATKHGTTYT